MGALSDKLGRRKPFIAAGVLDGAERNEGAVIGGGMLIGLGLLALLGGLVAPIFAPLGFGDWRASTALLTGFTAKESVVSTLTLLLGGDTSRISTLFTPFTAVVFLVFVLLYTPCVAAIATVKRELGSARAAAATVLIQCAIAWVMAFLVHCVGVLFGLA